MTSALSLLRDRRVRLPLIAAGVVAAYFLLKHVLPDVDLESLLEDVSTTLGAWTYLLVGLFAFLETGAFVGLVAPGETIVILGGAVAGQGATSLYVTIAIVWAAAWAGDSVSFLIGGHLGRDWINRHGHRIRITPERFTQVESYFKRHGGKTILIGRFIGLVRSLAPFIAGSSGMRYRQFVPYSILGTGLWAAGFTLIGYFASQSIDRAAELAGRGTLLLAIAIGVGVGVVWLVRRLRVPENRKRIVETMERNRVLRPLVSAGRVVKPEARFIWGRITPGGLGLEFTALLAALAVSLYVLVVYTALVSGDPGPTGADDAAMNVAEQLRATGLNEIVKAFTHLGSAAVVLPLALLIAVMLGIERRWADVGVLVAAMLIIVVATDVMKDQVGRPRPAGGLVGYGNEAFPSAHASYSTIYAALAVAIVVRLRPGLTNATAIVLCGIALTAAIGLSRVYLGVHYLSDVSAGWALGVAAFSGCATVAVAVSHLRQNWHRDRGREDRA